MAVRLGARSGAVPFWKLFKLRKWLPGVLATAAGLTGPLDYAFAQPANPSTMPTPAMPGAVAPVAPPAAPAAPPAAPEKSVVVHFDRASWDDVLDWYAKETGLTLITTVKPTGGLTLKPGKDRKFTMAEVTDLLNEALTQQKFILIRRHMTFFIHPADEKIDPTYLPRIELSELPSRGRSEVVQVIVPIEGMVVADVQEELKKLLTPFGSLVPLEKPNFLLLQDTVGNINRILATLKAVAGEKGSSDSLDHVCKWRRAQEIAETLKTLMTDKDTQATVTSTQAMQMMYEQQRYGRDGFGRGDGQGQGFGRDGWDRGGFGRDFGRGPDRTQPNTNARVKTVQIAVDPRRNAVLVTAPQDKIVLAREIVRKQDTPINEWSKQIVPEEPILKTYGVPADSATDVAKTLQAKMAWLNVVPLQKQNQVMVLAGPSDQMEVTKIINGDGTGGAATIESHFIPLTNVDPGDAASTIFKVMPTASSGGPEVVAVKSGNYGVIIRGTAAHVAEAKTILKGMGEVFADGGTPGAVSPNTRTLNLGANANALLVAELLGRAMEGTGKRVIIKEPLGGPKRPNGPTVPPKMPDFRPAPKLELPGTPPKLEPPRRPDVSEMRQPLPGRDGLVPVRAQIIDPERKDDKPIIISVVNNKLVIQSEDTKALDEVAALFRILMSEGGKVDESMMKVIPLKYVAAEDAAREITEIFNGPQQQGGQPGAPGGGLRGGAPGGGGPGGGRRGGGGLFGGGGGGGGFNPLALLGGAIPGLAGAADGGPAPNRVRVVAERSSNSLIVVKASPLDYLMIEKLLGSVIDGGVNDSAAVMKTFVIPVKNADADDMATVIKGVFKSAMGTTGGNPQVGGLPFFAALAGGGAQPQQSQQRPPALSLEVDTRSNSLVLLCTDPLYEDIKVLVQQLDNATVNTTEVVQLVKLRGVDPNVIQQAINAVQGRDTRNQGGFGGRGGFGQGGMGGLGQGGFGQGGFGQGGFGQGGFGQGGFGGNRGGGGFGTGGGGFGGNRGGGGGGAGGRGGGGGGRAGGRVGYGPTQEGPLNFDYRGKEAPSAQTKTYSIYDPKTDTPDLGYNRPAPRNASGVAQAGAYQPVPGRFGPGDDIPGEKISPPMRDPVAPPGYGTGALPGTGVYQGPAPRGTITFIPVQGLDSGVLRATDSKDLEIALEIIRLIEEQSKGTQPRVEVVHLDHGDANFIATTLNSLFARVTLGQDGLYVPASARTAQAGAITALGGASPTQNVYALALPRFNAILIAAPESRFDFVKAELKRLLDQPNSAPIKAFPLKKASAQIIAAQIQNFWNVRYPGETLQQNQFRVTFDVANNAVIVQGSPGDLKDVEDLIALMDAPVNKAVNDVRIFYLRNALADELGQILSQALSANVVSPIAQAQQTGPAVQQAGGAALFNQGLGAGPGGQLGGLGGQLGGGQLGGGQLGGQLGGGLGGGLGGQIGGGQLGGGQIGGAGGVGAGGVGATQVRQINAIIPTIGQGTYGGLVTKTNAIRFYSAVKRDPATGQLVPDNTTYETGYMEDVHIVSSARVNALIVSAPTDTMKLIEKLIENLDTVAAARSYVNVFRMPRGMDATLTANLIAQLFTAQGRQAAGGIGAQPGGAGGLGGAGQQGVIRPILTLTGNPSDGASLIDLRLSVDDRTNSLIVGGSLNDLDAIRSIIGRLEAADAPAGRYSEVVKLRNAAAADVALTLQNFFTQSLTAIVQGGFNTAYQALLRQVVVIAEPVSNTILISATPEYFSQIKQIIDRIDSQPPQVMIQVTIAEVQLNNAEEVGVEFGLQSPVLFTRGVSAGTTFTPGYNFNTPAPQATLPNSNLANGETVGFQGLGNLGVGRTSATQGFGGFVFSASSNTFSLLVRALKAQGRVDVLSRPQVQVADSQTGYINIGQRFPIPTGTTITNGLAQQGVDYVDIGITMRVTPRVNPDGKVLMRVEPSVISVQPTAISLGNGVTATAFNQQLVSTTVLASDGETIIIGGLINKQEQRNENGIPYFKDIPYVGALFRFRTHQIQRRELVFIMTPHIVRSEFDNARLLAEETGTTRHCWPDILGAHKHGGEVIGPAQQGARPVRVTPETYPGPGAPPGYVPGPGFFGEATTPGMAPGMAPGAVAPGATLPGTTLPGTIPPGATLPPAGAPVPPAAVPGAIQPGAAVPPATTLPGAAAPAPLPPAGLPGASVPPTSGVMPVGASHPTFVPPLTAQPAPVQPAPVQPAAATAPPAPAVPVPALTPAPTPPAAAQPPVAPVTPAVPAATPTPPATPVPLSKIAPGYIMAKPGEAPMATQPVVPLPGRNFGMAAGQAPPAPPATNPPAPGK